MPALFVPSAQDDLQQASSRCDALSEENARLKQQPRRERAPASPAQSPSLARRPNEGRDSISDPLNDQVHDGTLAAHRVPKRMASSIQSLSLPMTLPLSTLADSTLLCVRGLRNKSTGWCLPS